MRIYFEENITTTTTRNAVRENPFQLPNWGSQLKLKVQGPKSNIVWSSLSNIFVIQQRDDHDPRP